MDLYHNGTILEIYQKARRDISQRPWRVDDFDALEAAWTARASEPPNARGARPAASVVEHLSRSDEPILGLGSWPVWLDTGSQYTQHRTAQLSLASNSARADCYAVFSS